VTNPIISDYARQKVRDRFARDMIDTVLIQRGALGAFDPSTGETTGMSGAITVYAGAARLTVVTPSGDVSLSDGEIFQRQGSCQIPWNAPTPYVNDLLSIQASQDPDLVGTSWRVLGVDGGGSWGVLTTLTITGWYPSTTWAPS
jgi:hypothetical protein